MPKILKGFQKGQIFTEEHRANLRLSHLGKIPWNKGKETGLAPWLGKKRPEVRSWLHGASGWKQTDEARKRISETHSGPNHYRWNPNRDEVASNVRDNKNPDYHLWARNVKRRDGWKCLLKNDECDGKMEAHHIKNWVDYPELRYNINNGITLCHAHHPRGRENERRFESRYATLSA